MCYMLFCRIHFRREVLQSSLIRRNLSFSQINIAENNTPTSMDLGEFPAAAARGIHSFRSLFVIAFLLLFRVAGPTSYCDSLSKNTDAGNLAGKYLIISGKRCAV